MATTLNLIIKVTRRCNLRCAYCHEWRDSSAPVMSLATVEALVAKALARQGPRVVQFIWHGGEPTLAPISFYEHAFAAQQRHHRPDVMVRNTIQTNAFALGDRWLDFIATRGVYLGVSIDGPAELHDRVRLTVGRRPTYARVRATLDSLRERSIEFGVLSVLSPELIDLGARRTHEFLCSLGAPVVDLIPEDPPNVAGEARSTSTPFVGRRDWSAFMCELFDIWWHETAGYRVLTFESILRKLLGASARTCLISGGCFGAAFGVETDGGVFHCGLFEGVPEFSFGNINDLTFEDIVATKRFAEADAANAARVRALSACPAYGVCAGGCPHDAFNYRQHDVPAEQACCGWRSLIEHIADVAGPVLAARAGEPVVDLTVGKVG
jgi:uncharacterized protein